MSILTVSPPHPAASLDPVVHRLGASPLLHLLHGPCMHGDHEAAMRYGMAQGIGQLALVVVYLSRGDGCGCDGAGGRPCG